MNSKKKIFGIVILILLVCSAVLLTRTDDEKIEETALPENEVVIDDAEQMEETVEDSIKLQETETEGQETEQETKEEGRQETMAEESSVKTEETSGPTEESFEHTEDASREKKDTPVKNEHTTMHVSSIKVCEIGNYIGGYVEDGSDEFVNNVMMVVLENVGSEYIQLANIKINDKYLFEVTTLFPGKKVMVLEKNRAEYVEGMKIDNAEIFDVALFHEVPTMCEEFLKIETKDGMLSVTNISGKDFPGGKVFFKTALEDKYLGGITYFFSIPEMKAGENVKLSGGHFEEGRSEMLFVTHAE